MCLERLSLADEPSECTDEIPQFDALKARRCGPFGIVGLSSLDAKVPFLGQALEVAGGVLGLAVFDELFDQLAAWVVARVGRGRLGARQKQAALDLHQCRREDEEIAGPLDVDGLNHVEVFEELFVTIKGTPPEHQTLVPLVYLEAFERGEYGMACALGLMLFAFILGLSLLNLRLSRRREQELAS